MKAIIGGLLILVVYGYFLVYTISEHNLFGDTLSYALSIAENKKLELHEVEKFILNNMNIKNWDDFNALVKNDSTFGIEESSFRSSVVYKNIRFYFDENKNLKKIEPLCLSTNNLFENSKENYYPIISYLFQSTDYKNFNWWKIHFVWIVIIVFVGILITYNFFKYFTKRGKKYLINSIVFSLLLLIINYFHLIFFNLYHIEEESYAIINTGKLYDAESFLQLQVLVTHYQALISDINIITIVILSIAVFLLVKRTNQYNPLLNRTAQL